MAKLCCSLGLFWTPILFVLTLASDWAVLYGNVSFSIWILYTKKGTLVFGKGLSCSENLFQT